MREIRRNTIQSFLTDPIVDADGVALTSLTIQKNDVRLSKNSGNLAAASADQGASNAGAAHDELGCYGLSFNATDTEEAGSLKIVISEEGALLYWENVMVLTEEAYDAKYGDIRPKVNLVEVGGFNYADVFTLNGELEVADASLTRAKFQDNALDQDVIDGLSRLDVVVSTRATQTDLNEIAENADAANEAASAAYGVLVSNVHGAAALKTLIDGTQTTIDATNAKLNANFVQFMSANTGNKTIESLTTPKNLTITVAGSE